VSYIQIEGGNHLCGSLRVQGSKNAVLPILSAVLLHEGTTILKHVPEISDVRDTVELLRLLGCQVTWEKQQLSIRTDRLNGCPLPRSVVGRMRSSFLLAGALLGRCRRVETYYPGGCCIGARPIDMHLKGFERMGVAVQVEGDHVLMRTEELQGAEICLPYPSVGATENLILASVRARGETCIYGYAREPEVCALIECLIGMGARIQIDDRRIRIVGVERLQDSVYEIPGDRIVAGTFLAALGCCGGEICLDRVNPVHLGIVLRQLRDAGMKLKIEKDRIWAECKKGLPGGMNIVTGPFPEFPTDLQAVFMAMLTVAGQDSRIRETVFESRYHHVEQLKRCGARVCLTGETAQIQGGCRLHGALVEAKDLRAGAALVVAGLAAEGTTRVCRAEYVERGYEDLPGVLCSLGAKVMRYA